MIRACEPPRTWEMCATALMCMLSTPRVCPDSCWYGSHLWQRSKGGGHTYPCTPPLPWQWCLGCVVLVGTGELFEAEDNVLQGFDVRDLVQRWGLQLGQKRLDGLRVEPFGDGVQPLNAACCGFEHLEDGSLHGGITDQPWLVDAAVLAKHVAVQHGADSLFQAQNARIEIVAVASTRAAFAVSGVSVAIAGNPWGVAPVGLASSICAVGGCSGAAVAIRTRRPHSFAPILRKCPGRQCGCSQRLAVLVQINPNGLDIVEVTAKTKARARPLEGLCIG